MDVYQCPECELRFRTMSEMDAHLEADHPGFRAERSAQDDYLALRGRRHRSAHDRRHEPPEEP
jgi:hypothetical protein